MINPNSPINTFQQNYINGVQPFNQQNQNGPLTDYNMYFARGIDGARQFPQNPGKISIIFDSTPDVNTFYMKDTTGNGKPFRIFDYTEREEVDETKELNNLKSEVADLRGSVQNLVNLMQDLMGPVGKDGGNE